MSDWEHVLDDLVRVRGRALVRHAYLLTGDVAAAEDLVQDAIIATFARRSRVRTPAAVEGYVRRAILTTYIDGYRRQRRWRDARHLIARSEHALGHDGAVGDRADVMAALRTLAPRVRACVVLRFYDDLTVAEIAEQLGLSDGAVKRYLSDGMRALEAQLGPVRDRASSDSGESHTILERTTP